MTFKTSWINLKNMAIYIDETTHSFLKQEESPKTQRLYFLKKLHKTPISVRPIVSGTGGITEKVSAFLDHFLQPLLTNIPSYLKNSTELIEHIYCCYGEC